MPPNEQTFKTPQQIIKILQEVIKPETIKEILESLKIITTAINQIMTATTETTNHSKKVRRSKKKKQSNNKIKILYANVRGLKSKLKNIKMILFDTELDVAAFAETNLKTQ